MLKSSRRRKGEESDENDPRDGRDLSMFFSESRIAEVGILPKEKTFTVSQIRKVFTDRIDREKKNEARWKTRRIGYHAAACDLFLRLDWRNPRHRNLVIDAPGHRFVAPKTNRVLGLEGAEKPL
jgi:hypothetical protein